MADLKQLIKETIVKNIIDKVIFGLIITLIIFIVQDRLASDKREQIEREAILKLESSFIMNDAQILQEQISQYLSLVSKILSSGLSPQNSDKTELIRIQMQIESTLEVLSIYNNNIKLKSTNFMKKIQLINDKFDNFDVLRKSNYSKNLVELKKEYVLLLRLIKLSAIKTIKEIYK